MLDTFDRRAVETSLAANGFIRGSSYKHGGRRGHREWLHFTLHAGELRAVLNISIIDDLRPAAPAARERVRILALVHDGVAWHGAIDEVADARVPAGQLSARLGQLTLETTPRSIEIRGALSSAPIELDVQLVPQTFPSVASNVAIGDEPPINWLVLPRLTASGSLRVAGRTHTFAGAAAYHDHNWGYFSHQDFAWQWGHQAAAGPYSFVLTRLLDRAHTATFMQALLVWRGARQARVFRGRELTVEPRGFLRPARPFTMPAEASLLVDNTATEVPRELVIGASADGDRVDVIFEAASLARVVVPEDDSRTTTIIHEVIGRLHGSGTLHGDAFDIDEPAMFEFLGSVA